MAEPAAKPVLQKPPGYKEPNAPPRPSRPPAKKPVLPVSFHPKKKKRRSFCRLCCCYTCALVLILLVILAVAGCIFYIWYEPKLPVFHLQSLKFDRFNVTAGPDGPEVNSQAVVRIEVRNPNPVLKVHYGKTEVNLNADSVDLGTAILPAFTQGNKNTTVLKATTVVKKLLVESRVAAKLRQGFKAKSLAVGAEVRTGIGVGANGWTTFRPSVKVICDGLSLKEIEGGAVPKCKINILKWIYIT